MNLPENLATPAVNRPVHASDVRNLGRCRRLAVLSRRCERQPAREGSAAAFGTAVHTAMERFIRDGAMPDDSTAAGRAAIELLPHMPAGPVYAEVPFVVPFRGVLLGGTIDAVTHGSVTDWKTTGDWSRMLPTLAGDVQATWYSYAFTASGGDVPALRWRYVHSRTMQTRKLDGRIEPERIADFAREIDTILALDSVDPVFIPRPDARVCRQFGGCTFLRVCGVPDLAERFG